ncbi:MAG: ribosome biogenesis GTPase YlqF [Eubacterium sp.]|nr:ribosome biogenesis GTPase YlqF [Eubacterium sp.]
MNSQNDRKPVIQWYPGHMTSALRMMQENMKLIDIVIELLDARVPGASKNPDIDKLAKGKFRLLIMNKADLADPAVTARWKDFYEKKGFAVLLMDSRNRKDTQQASKAVQDICRERIERDRKRGIAGRTIKAMVVGIPNVGKSTFINSFAGRASAKTGNKPGVTRGKQWIRISKDMDLLDTPGILWPKFEDPAIGERLAWINAINEDILVPEVLAEGLLAFLQKTCCNHITDRYKITEGMSVSEAMTQIADIRKCLKKGNEPDYEKAAKCLLEDLRSGRLGRITLEFPEE